MITEVQPDKQKVIALKKMAEITLQRLEQTNTEEYATTTLLDYYDIIHKLIEALTLLDGVKIRGEGAHQELIDYIAQQNKIDEQTRVFLQQMRDYRNRISYEGFMVHKNYISLNKNKIEQIIRRLFGLLKDIKLIIFDLSDVCYTSEEPLYLAEFTKAHYLNQEEFENYYFDLLKKSEVDEITGEELWEKILAHFNIKADPKKIIVEMVNRKEEISATLVLVKTLREKYKTAYLTNYCETYWKLVEKKFDLKLYFDFGVISYTIKERKPHQKGFTAILSHFKVKPEETIFIDDVENNLIFPQQLGVHTIQFKNISQLTKDLRELGVEAERSD